MANIVKYRIGARVAISARMQRTDGCRTGRRHVANVIKYRIGARAISAQHLRLMGIEFKTAKQIIT